MRENLEKVDVAVVGAGPIGIACGVEVRRADLSVLMFDKGTLTDALCHYPRNLVWFSTPELLEIAGVPLICSGPKPTGPEVIRYYRRVAEHHELPARLYEGVREIAREEGGFRLSTSKGRTCRAGAVIIATGFFDFPNLLGVPGEELAKVSHYYDGPDSYYGQRVLVVGAGNGAVEAALELHRGGASEVALVHREAELKRGIKYWVRPDIENRIREGSIRAWFETVVERIEDDVVHLRRADGAAVRVENDFVLALTGYHSDFDFLERAGVQLEPETMRPQLDPETMETNVPGLYCAGVVTGGRDTGQIFIENCRVHAERIARHLAASSRV